MHDLLKHRDKRTQVDLAILDFYRAFDTVPHQRMLGKLSFYGIKGPLLNWIAAFFEGQTPTCGRRGDDIGSGTSRPWGTTGLSVGTTTVSFTYK